MIKVTPYRTESLTSFVNRAAAMRSMDPNSFLRSLFPSEGYKPLMAIPQDLDVSDGGELIVKLNAALDPEQRRLGLMTLQGTKPSIHSKWLRRAGGNSADGDCFSELPVQAWCPRCLLEDRSSGHDEFIRLSWRMLIRTFCWKHRRPLTTHCLECNDRQATTAYLFDGGNISLSCGKCGSAYATQLGLPDMSDSTALELGSNHRIQVAWDGAIQFETALERSLCDRSKKKDKGAFKDFSIAVANMILKSDPAAHAPIDLFTSAAFPAKRNSPNIRSMSRPYRASSIAVRRKVHGLLASLLKNKVNLFSIRGLQEGPWGRDPTFQRLRTYLEPEQNAELDRLLLRFPANWY